MSDREQLVQELIDQGALRTPAIIGAFRAIDRRDFVRDARDIDAYLNVPLPIGEGQTISQPFTVAFMLELLQPQPGDNILDVGSGSGWQTALLAHIVGEQGHVTGLEIIPSLCQWGKRNVAAYGFTERGVVEMHCQSGLEGYPPRAPFDKLVAAAAGEMVPDAWLAQVKVGGRIVTPVGSSILELVKQDETAWERRDYPGFAFVPLIDEARGQ